MDVMSVRSLKDKTIVITGGATGIGHAIADVFLNKEAKVVVIIDVNKEGESALAKLSKKHGPSRVVFHKADVSHASDLKAVYEKLVSTYRQIDVLINNAGIADETEWKTCMDVNATSVVGWSLKYFDHMRKDKGGIGGTIINMASIYGCPSYLTPYVPVYHATKFAVMGFTKSLGHKRNYDLYGVRVVAICPGFTRTNMVSNNRIWDESRRPDLVKIFEDAEWQDVDVVGRAALEVFEKADSGTAWIISGDKPIEEV